jgi:uridylate kinase
MLATTINGLLLQQALSTIGVESRVMSAINTDGIAEKYHWGHAMHCLQKGIPVIFVGGTGNPYFTTDTAGALRASEIGAEIVLKATKVDGIYNEDPKKNPHAVKWDEITYSDVLTKNLSVMDATAVALCRENGIPICVFNLFEEGAMLEVICGGNKGTRVI